MRWISPAELAASFDPRARREAEAEHMRHCVAQAKLEQDERHHYERMSLERERMDASAEAARVQARAAIELEELQHGNALGMANRTHILGIAAKSSALIDEMATSVLRQDEEWNRVIADTFRSVVTKEADLIAQERLRKLDQEHLIQKLRLECNLRIVETVLAHELQDMRIAFDKSCEIIFQLVERALGLGEETVDGEQIREWVREAFGKTGMA